MNFTQAVKTVLFKKYFSIHGRASRSEYWWFFLFCAVGSFLFDYLDNALGFTAGFMYQGDIEVKTQLLYGIFTLLTIIPSICVATRRLHDVNKSGWWQLLIFTIIGLIPLIYWLIKKSTNEENKWSETPSIKT